MKTNKHIIQQVEETFNSLNTIKEVKISTSFKQDVLDRLSEIKQEKAIFPWFTPKLQFAAMIVVLLVNVSAIMYAFSTTNQTSEIETFAQEYHLETQETYTLN